MKRATLILAAALFAIVAAGTAPVEAATEAYVLFEADCDSSSVGEALRSRSLANCKQLLVGRVVNEMIVHLACEESDEQNQTRYLSQAVMELAKVDRVKRATVLIVRRD